ncbi:hypothetical protein [Pseudorhodobacter sp. MZDSW-24AT]|uniref:hypothetical protein n=1 Tax=Pseudorhodobacter sp. MZDSW-24AT TaxID=2052957 RepID=UPI000C1EC6AE|nr:hypothetical protein [Pseudorhodobacter sp. MZDSW-24AT]PJF10779.1 hypothetical protein CUR21_02145 [Pseudorhodobacter sp. MZDSW-24AT]
MSSSAPAVQGFSFATQAVLSRIADAFTMFSAAVAASNAVEAGRRPDDAVLKTLGIAPDALPSSLT